MSSAWALAAGCWSRCSDRRSRPSRLLPRNRGAADAGTTLATVSWSRIQPCSWLRMPRPTSRCGAGRRQLLDERRTATRRKEATNGNGGTTPMNATPTLYEWAGGEAAIRRLMDCFYDRVERDELLSPYFPGGVSEEHRAHVSTWWSEVLGGPARYTEDLGGYEKMLAHHRGLGIAPEERHRFVSLLSFAADDAGLPATPSSARRSSPTPSGDPALRCTTPSRTPRSSSTRLSLAGAGARRPPSSPRKVIRTGTTAGRKRQGSRWSR